LTAIAGNESQISRDKGFIDEIKKSYPDLQIVDNRIGNNDIAKGLSNTLDILSRFPDLVGIFADNAQMGVGAGAALDERNLGSKVALVAYDATPAANGKLKQLFHSKPGELGFFAKYSTPVVANGKVYVGTFSNKVVQYGL